MSVSNPNKLINKSVMGCDGIATVTLSFDAASELVSRPVDIILLMDRSSSMSGQRMTFAKSGARQLINMVAGASGGEANKEIANGSRIGIVSFATTATPVAALTNQVDILDSTVDNISAGGSTNHRIAFEEAGRMLDPSSTNDQIVVMFTDGITTEGGSADAAAEELKKKGAEIFCIGLVNDTTNLKKWASDPDSIHVAATTDQDMLVSLFEKIAYEVSRVGAHDVKIIEEVNPDFKIIQVNVPTDGAVVVKDSHTLEWNMQGVGLTPQDTAVLSFDIMHIGAAGGAKDVNKSLSYSDRENNVMNFPNPVVQVDCSNPMIYPEPCPSPMDFQVEGCKDSVIVDALETKLQSLGRIIQVDVPVKNVCPGKRVAVAVILTEVDSKGVEHARGMKTLMIPAQTGTECQDLLLKCVHFVVPEELDVTGNTTSICNDRSFKARVMANYIDTDFVCCDPGTVLVKD